MSLLVRHGQRRVIIPHSDLDGFCCSAGLSWPLKNDGEVIWQNYSFTLLLLAILLCDSCPEQFYLALSL